MNAVTEMKPSPPAARVAPSPVASEAERVLRQSGYVALRRVQCEWQDGVIVLVGKVPSFFLKQMAQTLVSHIVGVLRVDNRIRVP